MKPVSLFALLKIWQFSRVPEIIRPMYIWEEFGVVDHLCDFQLNELRQKRDTGESVYQKFKVCSYILVLIGGFANLYL